MNRRLIRTCCAALAFALIGLWPALRAEAQSPGVTRSGEDIWTGFEPPGSPPIASNAPPRFGQRSWGLLVHAFSYAGYGGGVRAGWPWLGVIASGAWRPLVFRVDKHFKFFSTAQFNGELYVTFARAQARFAPGISAGYKYNTLLKSAGTAAFYAFVNLTKKFALQGQVGLSVFPRAERGVHARLDGCDSSTNERCSVDFLISPRLEFGTSIGVLFFP